jgi:hypothetical protein
MRFALTLLLLSGCYDVHGRAAEAPSCPPETELLCVRTTDTCGAREIVGPTCTPATWTWRCPVTTEPYEAMPEEAQCLPFDELPGVRRVAGAPVRVPTDDGCVWIVPELEETSGALHENVGILVDPDLPFGACPHTGEIVGGVPSSIVEVVEGDAPIVQLTGAYTLAGETSVTYRHFVFDEDGGFGMRDVGTAIGLWDRARRRVIVTGAHDVRWSPEIDLGDAAFAEDNLAYLYGCPPPIELLTEDCFLARIDALDRTEMWVGEYRADADPRDALPVFDAGPWRSAVTRLSDGRYLHVFSVGFGTNLEAHVAPSPEGPWSDLGVIAACDLPDDPEAYCAGPAIHEELADPLAPGTIVVSYSVGSQTPGWGERARENPAEYRTRLVRVPIP